MKYPDLVRTTSEVRALRVLIADDHEMVRKGVRRILSRDDIEVHEASDGSEAISKAVELKPDLIILDLTKPLMGGYAVAKKLREIVPGIPILLFSIHEGAQIIRDAKRIGVRGFVTKREAARTLLAAVIELAVNKGTFFPESMETTST